MGEGKKNGSKSNNNISARAILSDTFVPRHLNQINLNTIRERWVLPLLDNNNNPSNMNHIMHQMAESFIPRVPCLCPQPPPAQSAAENGKGTAVPRPPVHDHKYFKLAPCQKVPPALRFALEESTASRVVNWMHFQTDLDETTSLKEYTATFRAALRSEHEELLRLFEKYSLFYKRIRIPANRKSPFAHIDLEGISDARPSLNVGDIVLLRPQQPLIGRFTNQYTGRMECHPYPIEIESRILSIVRGRSGKNKIVPDTITISWELTAAQMDALHDHMNVREYAIRFVPSTTVIDRSLTTLDWLETLSQEGKSIMQDILFPVMAPSVKPLTPEQKKISCGEVPNSDISKPLNEKQRNFVQMVRARTLDPSFEETRPPMILTGPAGTGKTKTLVTAIADCLGLLEGSSTDAKNNRVLVCCPSHAASDVLTRRLSPLLERKEIFRLYDSSRPSNTVPGSILPFTCQVPGSDRFTIPGFEVWNGFRVIICTCIDAHVLYRAQITNESIGAKRTCFHTFLTSNTATLGLNFGQVTVDQNPFFTHLFIDEAAQATEPEILCPISCVINPSPPYRKVEIALIGDPRQLSPRVYHKNVADSLGRSFMERLLRRPVTCVGGGEESLLGPIAQPDYLSTGSLSDLIRYYANVDGQEQLTIFLTQNYRGHPSFLMMPSAFFYFDRLESARDPNPDTNSYWCNKLRAVEALSRPVHAPIATFAESDCLETNVMAQCIKQKTWPIHFRGVHGRDSGAALKQFSGTDSWQNILEAEVVLDLVTTLVKEGLEPVRIGVMTPFRGQVVAIRKLLREKYFHDVNVGTIENYQAVEQDVIILSLTRANHVFVNDDVKRRMGVFGQPKQANVALTRAENLFIVVGDPDGMWNDECWQQWLWFCLRNGLWYGQGLKQWNSPNKPLPLINLDDMNYIPTLDLTRKKTDNAIVVSTLEKIHRLH